MTDALHPADVAFGVVASFLAGVFFAGVGWPTYYLVIGAPLAAGMVAILRWQFLRLCLYCVAALTAGTLYWHAFGHISEALTHLPTQNPAVFRALIVSEPQPIEKSILLTARLMPPWRGTVTLFAPRASEFEYGDIVEVSGKIGERDDRYDHRAVFSPKITLVAKGGGSWLRASMLSVKHAILRKFDEALPRDEAALLGGMLLGARATFAPELKDAMTLSGTTHLVAVSGYNISIIVVAIDAVLRVYFSRRATFITSSIILMLFILMIGPTASAVRAGVMGFLALFARQMGEEFSMRNAIVFTAAVMILLEPRAITKNLGFMLSFLALIGIVYVAPAVKTFLWRGRESDAGLFNWKENAIMTVSAQLAVTPVLILGFGSIPALGIFANLLIIEVVPITMFLGAALIPIGFISHNLLVLAGKVVWLPLAYELFIIRLFAAVATPLPLPIHSGLAAALYYIALALFSYFYRPRRIDSD